MYYRSFQFNGHTVEVLRDEQLFAFFVDGEFVESGYAGPLIAEAAAQRFVEDELPTLEVSNPKRVHLRKQITKRRIANLRGEDWAE